MIQSLLSVGGLRDGSLFRAAPWVDRGKPPGATPQPQSWRSWLRGTLSLSFIVHSPNLVWLLIAAAVYCAAPYDVPGLTDSHAGCRKAECRAALWSSFFLRRLAVNIFVAGAYYGFWHLSLYHWGWGRRKYRGVKSKAQAKTDDADADGFVDRYEIPKTSPLKNNGPYPSVRTMLQNIWYWFLGLLQWTCWETCFVFLYASGRLPYLRDDQIFGGGYMPRFVLLTLFVPVWRGAHFYFSHRLLHVRPLYRFVHSLHHRNVDIEPFAGLCMHPTEHLFYWVCVAPSLYVLGSPFHMLWNGMHLILSPAASHSGWEDHFQGDQFHYLHHAKFECNYGSASMPFDFSNGTFRDRIVGVSTPNKGGAVGERVVGADKKNDEEEDRTPPPLRPARFKPLRWRDALPSTRWDATYHMICLGLAALVARAGRHVVLFGSQASSSSANALALLVSVGPVASAVMLRFAMGDRLSIRWPFHKESSWIFGLHLALGVAMTMVPVFHTVEALLQAPGRAVACGWLECLART